MWIIKIDIYLYVHNVIIMTSMYLLLKSNQVRIFVRIQNGDTSVVTIYNNFSKNWIPSHSDRSTLPKRTKCNRWVLLIRNTKGSWQSTLDPFEMKQLFGWSHIIIVHSTLSKFVVPPSLPRYLLSLTSDMAHTSGITNRWMYSPQKKLTTTHSLKH